MFLSFPDFPVFRFGPRVSQFDPFPSISGFCRLFPDLSSGLTFDRATKSEIETQQYVLLNLCVYIHANAYIVYVSVCECINRYIHVGGNLWKHMCVV